MEEINMTDMQAASDSKRRKGIFLDPCSTGTAKQHC
jgi:hypothetical protein